MITAQQTKTSHFDRTDNNNDMKNTKYNKYLT